MGGRGREGEDGGEVEIIVVKIEVTIDAIDY